VSSPLSSDSLRFDSSRNGVERAEGVSAREKERKFIYE